MEETYGKLVERLGEVQDIAAAAGVLAWDQRTKMPAAGAQARADQLSTLTRLAFERFTVGRGRQHARGARTVGRVARVRLGRGERDPRRPS